jgi:hypothetical protein
VSALGTRNTSTAVSMPAGRLQDDADRAHSAFRPSATSRPCMCIYNPNSGCHSTTKHVVGTRTSGNGSRCGVASCRCRIQRNSSSRNGRHSGRRRAHASASVPDAYAYACWWVARSRCCWRGKGSARRGAGGAVGMCRLLLRRCQCRRVRLCVRWRCMER